MPTINLAEPSVMIRETTGTINALQEPHLKTKSLGKAVCVMPRENFTVFGCSNSAFCQLRH